MTRSRGGENPTPADGRLRLAGHQRLLPVRPGLSARQTHDYRRATGTSRYAALGVASGTVIGKCRPMANGVWTKEPADIIKKALRHAR